MSRPRARLTTARASLLVSCLLLAACSPPDDSGTYGSPSVLPSESDTPSSRPSPTTQRERDRDRAEQRSHPDVSHRDALYRDAAGVGAMAKVYLRASPAARLVVEVDYVHGRAPSSAALNHLRSILERETDKPGGVETRVDDPIPASSTEYSFKEIERLEARYRDTRSRGSRASIWIVYLNGDLADEEGTLGVAYRASAAALFADRIQGAATTLVNPGSIERAVLTHEIGHLLALVNIGYRSEHDHEDPDHPNHSRFKDSVMYWAIEDVSVVSLLSGGPPADFDRFDRDDLRALRS